MLEAQLAGLQALRAGPNGREIDAAARAIVDAAGHGEFFGHGLGHGVGLEIHEAPRLSRTAPEQPIVAGNVVTVEPGVYLPGLARRADRGPGGRPRRRLRGPHRALEGADRRRLSRASGDAGRHARLCPTVIAVGRKHHLQTNVCGP